MSHIKSFLQAQVSKKPKRSKKLPKIEVGEWIVSETRGFLRVDCVGRHYIGLSDGGILGKGVFWYLVEAKVFEVYGHCKQIDGPDGRRVDTWSKRQPE